MSRSKCKGCSDVAGTANKCQLLDCTTAHFRVIHCKIKNVFCVFMCFFLCIICAKGIINLVQYSIIAGH